MRLCLAVVASLTLCCCGAPEPQGPGVVFERVEPGGAQGAGLLPGDVLLGWERDAAPPENPEPASGSIRSPLDLDELEIEEAERGVFRLVVRRNGKAMRVVMPVGRWYLITRPQLADTELALFSKSLEHLDNGRMEQAAETLGPLLSAAWAAGDTDRAVWLALEIGAYLCGARRWDESHSVIADALRRLGNGAPGELAARLWEDDGKTFERQEEFVKAEHAYRSALHLRERVSPGSLQVALLLQSLGKVATKRSDLARADDLLRKALQLQEAQSPHGVGASATLQSLGLVAGKRGDLDAAQSMLGRALALEERAAPFSIGVAAALNNLGMMALDKGDLATAEARLQKALPMWKELMPDSPKVAATLTNLGAVAQKRGDFGAAEQMYRRALAIGEEFGPETLGSTTCLRNLGELALARGALDAAEALFARELAILRKKAPGTDTEAECLHALGRVALRRSNPADAADHFLQAVDALESQTKRLGGVQEVRAAFGARYRNIYSDSLETLVELERLEAAFDVLERSRGRILLSMLAERDLHISSDRASPLPPRPLHLNGVRESLDPGTLMLAFNVGAAKTTVFAVDATHFQVYTVPLGAEALNNQVAALRALIGLHPAGPRAAKAILARCRSLYDALLGPAHERISAATRLLVSPDGPLHALPFSALARPEGGFLVESKPVHTILSGTLYAEQRKRRPASAGDAATRQIVLFGDPRYPEAADGTALRWLRARGHALAPLSATRDEVRAIAGLYSGAVQYLGAQATEEQAKSIGNRAGYVHFACHGLLDERFPMDSALVLTLPEHVAEGQDDGLLQVWEIFETVRLDADLVTLSACDTALGREMGGEGLLSLTRAFQFAGARSVLASLWKVSDASTSVLMERFYANLRAGLPKDEALRQAQLALLRGGTGDPAIQEGRSELADTGASGLFHWAGFVLAGDWL